MSTRRAEKDFKPRVAPPRSSYSYGWLITLGLVALILVCYWQVWSFQFVNYDDGDYVAQNGWVQKGLSSEGVKWAFTTNHASNWHPLTWLSHMLDWTLYGNDAGGHHFTNVLLHCANSILLFLLLRRMTGALWRSAAVAALFAIHPLHVESVAWVSERKDVLSTFFGLLSFYFYSAYAEKKKRSDPGSALPYALSLSSFALSLMSKPMLVTMPFALLLLDAWPLGRIERFDGANSKGFLWRLAFEKIPFLLLSIISCLITLQVQSGKTMQRLSGFSVTDRLMNVVVSYTAYLEKIFLPKDLAFFYPLLGAPGWAHTALAATVLLAISLTALYLRRKNPAVLIGWLWYVGTLVPVIGIVHVGEQAIADRYTYIPLIGIFLAIVWIAGELLASRRMLSIAIAAIVTVSLALVTNRQVGYWRDSKTLLERALAVTKDNFIAHNNYGVVLAESGQFESAIEHYRRAIEIKPHYARAHSNLGSALTVVGRFDEAVAALEHSLSLRPNEAETHYNLAVTLARQQDYAGTILHCRSALELNPGYSVAHFDLGLALVLTGEHRDAIEHFREYLRVFPNDVQAKDLLARAEKNAANK